MEKWWVYILQCEDGSFYTGTALNVQKRFLLHKAGKGAKYTRSHKPVAVVFSEEHPSRAAACVREAAIKKLSRQEKESLSSA